MSKTTRDRADDEDIRHWPNGDNSHEVSTINESHENPDEHIHVVTLDENGEPIECECKSWEYGNYNEGEEGDGCKHMVSVRRDTVAISEATGHPIERRELAGGTIVNCRYGDHHEKSEIIGVRDLTDLGDLMDELEEIGIKDPAELLRTLPIVDQYRR
jgi:hypothetical protein